MQETPAVFAFPQRLFEPLLAKRKVKALSICFAGNFRVWAGSNNFVEEVWVVDCESALSVSSCLHGQRNR
jgi:hypothetical protein